ncbi:MAG: 4-alpha-glucanotransferase, partial [Bacteroidales bacterium]
SKTGQKVLQILPVNDTTINNNWEDSYPYGAVSIFALHPLYINLEEVGIIKDNDFMKDFNKKSQEINALDEIDYDLVSTLKRRYLKKIFSQDGSKTLQSRDFKQFFNSNSSWLKPYAAFSFLRDLYGTADFSNWNEYSKYDKRAIDILTSSESDSYSDISLYYFIQYHLDKQLKTAHKYVNSRGIILKGDIPIGINRCSVEAWCEPQYFNFNGQAGAPPDDFSVKGQNWGFPTYNWDYMEREGYDWWKRRFRKMAEYFDAYRIDHILGFFRIWEIPSCSVEGLLGFFNPSLPFTADEIRMLGYDFNYERDCTPYIRESILNEYFKDDSTEIISCFFDFIEFDVYRFKSEFSNQRKIEDFFVSNQNHKLLRYKESLFSLITEVLFIQDPYDNNKYHPRISAQYTRLYNSLPEWLKESYNKIYNLFFYHRNDGYWYNNAMKKLPSLISSTEMLVCGEDLGMIPSCVPTAMKSLSILSLEIERMPKDPKSRFGNTSEYPYLSVCTTGTHDTSTLRGWWEENPMATQEYYNNILHENGKSPIFCESWICIKIIKNHLHSPSMLTILPLQDWLSIFPELRKENPNSERINIPSNPKHYWRYRMHLNIEEMSSNDNLISALKTLISESGR